MKDLLIGKEAKDFGRELIPAAIRGGELKVMAYHLDSFWEDIGGSIADFYRLNISLTGSKVQSRPYATHSYLFSLSLHPIFVPTPYSPLPPASGWSGAFRFCLQRQAFFCMVRIPGRSWMAG